MSTQYVLMMMFVSLLTWQVGTPEPDLIPRTQDFDGVEMVYIPAGCFEMGTDTAYPTEGPAHEVCIADPFWLDRFEVTNAQTASTPFENPPLDPAPELPRVNVIWLEASRFCEARGARLPTEAEWEYAARGPDATTYPWGDPFDDTPLANVCDATCDMPWHTASLDDGFATLAPVGSFPAGRAWSGVEDMAGNVWEWTSSTFNEATYPYPYDAGDGREARPAGTNNEMRVARGGSWMTMPDGTRATARRGEISWLVVSPEIGFRCARDTP